MKVLFVASGNTAGESSIIIKNQADSLMAAGLIIDFYLVRGKGLIGYLRNVYPLYKYIRNGDFDLIHSHYSISAMVTTMAMFFLSYKPHIVSLMGSDTQDSGIFRHLTMVLHKLFWTITIVKSKQMLLNAGIDKALIIPNGVDINKIEKIEKQLNIIKSPYSNNEKRTTILFAADPERGSKNINLAKSAVASVNCNLKVVYNKSHEEIIKEIFETDVLILTSLWEGSPNIVKEAMACN